MNIFEQYPNFIASDPRTQREKSAYTVTPAFMSARHECFFWGMPDLKGKTVLDLGCCVGGTGAWVLAKGASFYTGVEYHKDLADIAITNLAVFENEKWKIIQQSVEDFLNNPDRPKYDIIVASGLIYSFYEPIPILNNIAKLGDSIIIESGHSYGRAPHFNSKHPFLKAAFNENQIAAIEKSQSWVDFVESEIVINYSRCYMILGTSEQSVCYNASVPSMGFIINHFEHYGFKVNPDVNNMIKKFIPDIYNITNRYAVRLEKKLDVAQSQGFVSAVTEKTSDSIIKKWKDIDVAI